MKKNLVLTGMMGVGKSTIGRNLAKVLALKFIDIDQIIESKEKTTIKSLFEKNGEDYFRKIEKKITLEELKKNNQVIALGGGAFLNPQIRKEIKNTCISFWLDLNIKMLLQRLKSAKKRPLLNQDKLEQSINKIYSARKKIYNESDFKIRCSDLNRHEIVKKIVKIYESSRN